VSSAVNAGDLPALRAVEVVRARGSEVLDDLAADEVDLEEAGRDRNGQCVRPAGEGHRLAREHLLLTRGVRVELG
jgi:hypothetical protein